MFDKSFFLVVTIILTNLIKDGFATLSKCYLECKSPPQLREVGPTRPYFEYDPLGEIVSLTKSHPYAITQTQTNVTIVEVKVVARIVIPSSYSISEEVTLNENERKIVEEIWRGICSTKFESNKVDLDEQHPSKLLEDGIIIDIGVNIHTVAEFNGYDSNQTNEFVNEDIIPTLATYFHSSAPYNVTQYLETIVVEKDVKLLKNAKISLQNLTVVSLDTYSTVMEKSPNIYSKFCCIGCSFFFTSNNKTLIGKDTVSVLKEPLAESYLSSCLGNCDELYSYNISVAYNNLLEIARLECRDGCIIALKRCQPGYFCLQPYETIMNGKNNRTILVGGSMHPCPPGSYRDIAYNQVSQCIPCPPGRYRESQRGRHVDSCKLCPERTFNPRYGATSISNCERCPAGTFNNEKGASECNCITRMSCDKQYDAEMRDTVPYIGRW